MATRIDGIRVRAVKSVNDAGDISANYLHPPHDLIEGTRVFIQGAVDFLCSLIDEARLNEMPVYNATIEEHIAHSVASKVVGMLWIAARRGR